MKDDRMPEISEGQLGALADLAIDKLSEMGRATTDGGVQGALLLAMAGLHLYSSIRSGEYQAARDGMAHFEDTIAKGAFLLDTAKVQEQTLWAPGAAHDKEEAAERDIAMVREGDTATLLADQVSVRGDDGWYVYASQEDADSDDDGSSAIAVIEREASEA